MEKRIEKIKAIMKSGNVAKGYLSDEYLFTVACADLFYFDSNIGHNDIKSGFVDGSNDGGMDFVLLHDEEMYLIQGKTTNNVSVEDIINIFNKMSRTVVDFEKEKYSGYNERLRTTFLETYESMGEEGNINLVLFTKSEICEEMRKKIDEKTRTTELINYKLHIYDKSDIEDKISASFMEKEFVSEDFLFLNEPNNYLQYNENAIITNITASSLKKIFHKHKGKGLFNLNLREHIVHKNVDDGIKRTIQKEPEMFWYYNNGITIICSDYNIDGNKIRLYDFSIINGAQTTTKIGESTELCDGKDFSLVCKIIKTEKNISEEYDFITKVSEATNSQKPIQLRDLRANRKEQKILQINSMKNENSLAIEIKRGVRAPNYRSVEPWQRVKNEYLGQLVLSGILQKPGTARSGKKTIFSSDKIYNQIFRRNHDYDTLYELVYIANIYEKYKESISQKTDNMSEIALTRNGKFTVLAMFFYLYKKAKGIIKNYKDEELGEYNVKGFIVKNYRADDLEEIMYDLFSYITHKLTLIYIKREHELQLTSYSNFFKTDKTYKDFILKDFEELIDNKFDAEKIAYFTEIFNNKDS